jgi:hypothetical protein
MRFKFCDKVFLKACLLVIFFYPSSGTAAPKFFRRCLDLLSSIPELIQDSIENYRNKPKYIEDSGKFPVGDEIAILKGLFRDIQIGYDHDDSAAIEHRWNRMWTKYTGNLWDIKYSDPPRIYGLNEIVKQSPTSKFFRVFAQKAVHFKDGPAPIAYIIGWENVSFSTVEWAIHVVFVSGYNFWIFGKIEGSKRNKIRPWDKLP